MTQEINLHSITQTQFINIMQEIGMNNDTFKYARYKSIRTQQYKSIDVLPPDLSDQINLFKGLVLCERDFDWIGGSAASNIKVYREISSHPFMQRHKDKLDELINWTLQNRSRNPYTPFGSWRYSGCKSVEDMKVWDLRQERRYRLQAEKEELIKKEKAKKKIIMKKMSELHPFTQPPPSNGIGMSGLSVSTLVVVTFMFGKFGPRGLFIPKFSVELPDLGPTTVGPSLVESRSFKWSLIYSKPGAITNLC